MVFTRTKSSLTGIQIVLILFLTVVNAYSQNPEETIAPVPAESYYNRGNAYTKKGSYDLALLEYNKAIESNPQYAQAFCERGFAYDSKGDLDNAISDYTKAIEIDSTLMRAYEYRGNAYIQKGKFAQAISDLNKALEIEPKNAEVYFDRGLAYAQKGNFTQAISDFNKAIEIKPGYIKAYYNRGLAYAHQGDYEQAILELNDVIAMHFANDTGAVEHGESLCGFAQGYSTGATTDFKNKNDDKSRLDVHKAEELGQKIDTGFREELKKISREEK